MILEDVHICSASDSRVGLLHMFTRKSMLTESGSSGKISAEYPRLLGSRA